jgi:hypothetical protein
LHIFPLDARAVCERFGFTCWLVEGERVNHDQFRVRPRREQRAISFGCARSRREIGPDND